MIRLIIILYIKIDDVTSICSENFWTEECGDVSCGEGANMVQTFNNMNKAEMRSGLFILFFNIIQKYIIKKKIKSKFKKFNFILFINIFIIIIIIFININISEVNLRIISLKVTSGIMMALKRSGMTKFGGQLNIKKSRNTK